MDLEHVIVHLLHNRSLLDVPVDEDDDFVWMLDMVCTVDLDRFIAESFAWIDDSALLFVTLLLALEMLYDVLDAITSPPLRSFSKAISTLYPLDRNAADIFASL